MKKSKKSSVLEYAKKQYAENKDSKKQSMITSSWKPKVKQALVLLGILN